jgi:hypothetical protein
MSATLTSRLAAGQIALLRELCGRPGGDADLRPPAGVRTMLALAAAIGLARNVLSVWLGIVGPGGKWYSFDPDIVYAMLFWPPHLLFFGVLMIHGGLRLVGVRGVSRQQLLAYFFYLQTLHLLVPFLDLLGFSIGLPYRFPLWEGHGMTPYFSNGITMTLGIIAAWLITFRAAFRILLVRLRVPKVRSLLVMTVVWLLIVATTYIFFPTFNTVFDTVVGLQTTKPPCYWGYGTFFMLTTVIGMLYSFRKQVTDDG